MAGLDVEGGEARREMGGRRRAGNGSSKAERLLDSLHDTPRD
jgi:hypothetical protein